MYPRKAQISHKVVKGGMRKSRQPPATSQLKSRFASRIQRKLREGRSHLAGSGTGYLCQLVAGTESDAKEEGFKRASKNRYRVFSDRLPLHFILVSYSKVQTHQARMDPCLRYVQFQYHQTKRFELRTSPRLKSSERLRSVPRSQAHPDRREVQKTYVAVSA